MTAPKPPPQEMWAVMREDGTIRSAHHNYTSAHYALSRGNKISVTPLRLVHVRVRVEVIDD